MWVSRAPERLALDFTAALISGTATGAIACRRAQMSSIPVQRVLRVLADFHQLGGASLALVSWELFVAEQDVIIAWQRAIDDGWIKPSGHDDGEQLWQLTPSGRAAARRQASGLKVVDELAE